MTQTYDRVQGMTYKPGRELDALIAEKVMGLKKGEYYVDYSRLTVQERNVIDRCQGWAPELLRPYSTDIAAAWQVVEKLKLHPKAAEYGVMVGASPNGGYFCWLASRDCEAAKIYAAGDTGPHAICLAALRARGRIGE